MSQTSANSSRHEEYHVCISYPASHVEILNWELSNHSQAKQASDLGSCCVVGPVVSWFLSWSRNNFIHLAAWEPRSQNIEFLSSLRSPFREPFINLMGRNTKANQLIVFNIIGDLVVEHSPLSIIVGVLLMQIKMLVGQVNSSYLLIHPDRGYLCICHCTWFPIRACYPSAGSVTLPE